MGQITFKANLYYAMGGGLGQLARARAVEHTLELQELRVLTAALEAGKVFHSHNLLKVQAKHFAPAQYQKWMNSRLKRYLFSEVYIDTYPAGFLGELTSWLPQWEGKLHYIARAMNMEAYQDRIPADFPLFEKSYILEPLPEAQESFIQKHSKSVETLELVYPQPALPPQTESLIRRMPSPIWLVVHAGPASEVDDLLTFARNIAREERMDPTWLVCTMCDYSSVHREVNVLKQFPIWPLYDQVDRIFTACGFNAMLQTEAYRDKHHFLPFERKYDDQLIRAKRREESLS